MEESSALQNSSTPGWVKKIEVMHPYQMLLYLSMFGSLLIFGFLVFSWKMAFSTLQDGNFKLPIAMYLNTILLLITFPLALGINKLFNAENLNRLRIYIHIMLYVLVVFSSIQLFSWKLLSVKGILFNGHASDGYLYVLSGAHLLHLLGGIVLLLFAANRIDKALVNPVNELIYTTNAFEKLRLKLISTYIHFLDLGWILIIISLHYLSVK